MNTVFITITIKVDLLTKNLLYMFLILVGIYMSNFTLKNYLRTSSSVPLEGLFFRFERFQYFVYAITKGCGEMVPLCRPA